MLKKRTSSDYNKLIIKFSNMFFEKQESDYSDEPISKVLKESRGIWKDRPEDTLTLARKLRQQAERRHAQH